MNLGVAPLAVALSVLGCAPQMATTATRVEAVKDADGLAPFAQDFDVNDVVLSPKGTYFALTSYRGGLSEVAFLNTETKEVIGGYRLAGDQVIVSLEWASDERVVIVLGERNGPLDEPRSYGELIAVNIDGSNLKTIFGYRAGEFQTGSRIKKAKSVRAFGHLMDRLPNDKNHILVHATPFGAQPGEVDLTAVYKVNIYSGIQKRLLKGPGYAVYYVTDEHGEVRAALSAVKGGDLKPYVLDADGGWQAVAESALLSADAQPVSFSAAQGRMYVYDATEKGGVGLFAFDPVSNARSVVSAHPLVAPFTTVIRPGDQTPVAVQYEPDYSEWKVLDAQDPVGRLIERLTSQFSGQRVSIRSRSEDGAMTVVLVSSDRDPGTFYLVDGKTNQMAPLLRRHESVDPTNMRPMEAFRIKSRDGLLVHGYLTLPSDEPPAPVPMVVMPHGGPHNVRDLWQYDPDVQMLAANGYAVLQVNFRGSGGYGPAFTVAGFEQWGDKVQNDIIDAIKWAVGSKVADPERICTYGSSFGGYSAAQLAIRAPDKIRCVVGVAGVYDLVRLTEETDIVETGWGRDVLQRYLGSDEGVLAKFSPARNAGQLDAPVLLIHGQDDRRAPVSQAQAMKEALQSAGKTCETVIMPDEGHGFRSEANRLRAYKKILSFLKTHIGAGPKLARAGGS